MTPQNPENWPDLVAGPRSDAHQAASLRDHPALGEAERARLQEELALNALLDAHRPPPPVSSNFTARVLAGVERASDAEGERPAPEPWWRRLFPLPRVAAAAILIAVGAMIWTQTQAERDIQLAAGVLEVGKASAIPGLDAASLADFEVIQRVHAQPKPEDEALILALAQ